MCQPRGKLWRLLSKDFDSSCGLSTFPGRIQKKWHLRRAGEKGFVLRTIQGCGQRSGAFGRQNRGRVPRGLERNVPGESLSEEFANGRPSTLPAARAYRSDPCSERPWESTHGEAIDARGYSKP